MHRIPFTCAAATLAVLLPATVSYGQMPEVEDESTAREPTRAANEAPQPSAARDIHLNLVDQKLAITMAVDAWGQIEMGEFALESLGSDAVRQLLASRVKDQRALAARLEELTRGKSGKAIEEALAEIAQAKKDTSASRPFRLLDLKRNATAMLVRIRLEIVQEYADMLQCELAGGSPLEFDRRYLRCHVLDQMQLLAALKVFESQASADFAQVIHQAWSDGQEYLGRAKLLLSQLESPSLADVTAAQPPLTKTAAER